MADYFVLTGREVKQGLESRASIEDWVSRAQKGDKGAFTLLYQEFVRPIYRYVYVRVGNHAREAEDITQEVFLKALDNLDRYRYNGRSFASWLFRIAHNLVIDYYRLAKKNRCAYITEATVIVADDDPAAEVEQSLGALELERAIEKLPAKQGEVISLRFGMEMSVAETAVAMGKTEGTVKKLQHVALARLRKLMQDGQ